MIPGNGGTFLSAARAAELLRVSKATLYAYVSRGLVSSVEPRPGARHRLYRRAEIVALREAREGRKDPSKVARRALRWGAPVLESSITLIAEDQLYYRGLPVEELCRSQTFEEVAALLWGVPADELAEAEPPAAYAAVSLSLKALSAVERMQVALPLAGSRDYSAYDRRPRATARCGGRILRLLAGAATTRSLPPEVSLATHLQTAWKTDLASRKLLNSALILSADHELNASAFTARTIASAGSSPYDVVAGGLGALRGPRHGGYSQRVEELLEELSRTSASGLRSIGHQLGARLKEGKGIPGFGHPLYPNGDPRPQVLLTQIANTLPASPRLTFTHQLEEAARELIGERPTIDFALAALAFLLRLPRGSALTLFALGRTAGWIAHAIEQYQADELIRPRARYVGPLPGEVRAD